MGKLCLVFDLDDTLYAERDFAVSAFGAVGRWAQTEWGVAGLDDELTTLLDQGYLGQLFSMALKARRPDHAAADLAAMRAIYQSHVPETLPLFDDARRILDELEHRPDVRLGLITDGTATVQAAKIFALGIGDKFDQAILTGTLDNTPGDRAYYKPHPLAFELMEAALGVPGDRLVYIGDNPAKDFQAPNRLGWTTVQIDRPDQRATRIHRGATPLPAGNATHIIPSFDALAPIIGLA
jgi:putative hydrolase of the HAD superfamily